MQTLRNEDVIDLIAYKWEGDYCLTSYYIVYPANK